MASNFIANREQSLLLIIDLQAGMEKIINDWPAIGSNTLKLLQAANLMAIPSIITEQYPKGLGHTSPELLAHANSTTAKAKVIEKQHFSACLTDDFLTELAASQKQQIIVVGTEAHVCVLQTCLDLLAQGYQVHLVSDAIGSRKASNKQVAENIIRQAGGIVSSCEIIIFQWLKQANTELFKQTLPLIR